MGGAVQKTMDAEVAVTERLKQLLETMPEGRPNGVLGRGTLRIGRRRLVLLGIAVDFEQSQVGLDDA